MKHIILIAMTAGLLISCGESTSDNVQSAEIQALQTLLSDQWCNQFDGQETMTISSNNSFQTDVCGVIGSYQLGENLSFKMTVTSSGGGSNCTPVGVHDCTYVFKNNNSVLDLRCEIQSNFYVTTFNRGACL